MKKSKVFMAAGTCILAIAGFLATKANKRTQVTSGELPTSFIGFASGTAISFPAVGRFTTVKGTGYKTVQLALITVSGHVITKVTVKTLTNGVDLIYWN